MQVIEQAARLGGAMTKHLFQEADTQSMVSQKSGRERALEKAVECAKKGEGS